MAIDAAVAGADSPARAPDGRPESIFNLKDLRPSGIRDRLGQWFVDNPEWAFRFFRRFWPILHVPFTSWWLITRFDDVQEVLAHDKVFEVPF